MPKLSSKTKVIIAVTATLVLLVGGGYLLSQRSNEQAATVDEDNIVYEPATEVEKDETEQHKDRIAEEQDQKVTDNSSKQEVKPLITSWGQDNSGSDFYVNGYVPGVVEQDGTCTLTMKKDGMTVSQQKTAFFNAQSTSCGRITISFNELSVGSWQALLSYSSGTSAGSSNVVEVEVE